MKRSFYLIISLLLISVSLSAQQSGANPPDLKKISRQLSKESGLYSKLMERYQKNDTSLTPADYHVLYYGYSLQQGFDPMKETKLSDSLTTLFLNAGKGKGDFEEILEISDQILNELPFDIRTLDPAIYAAEMLNYQDKALRYKFRMGRLIETIFNSGDGLTTASPFYVISVGNIPDMVRALGFEAVTIIPEQSGNLYYFRVKENDYGITGFYFRIAGKEN